MSAQQSPCDVLAAVGLLVVALVVGFGFGIGFGRAMASDFLRPDKPPAVPTCPKIQPMRARSAEGHMVTVHLWTVDPETGDRVLPDGQECRP